MKVRVLTAVLGIPLVIAVIVFSHTPVLPVAVSICCMVGVFEMLGCIDVLGFNFVSFYSLLVSFVMPFGVFMALEDSTDKFMITAFLAAVMFIYFFSVAGASVLSKGKLDVSAMALTAVTTVYIIVGFTSLIMLRALSVEGSENYGLCLFILVFVGAWIPDCGGYFGGRAFGKHKLIPDVSPKKTVEGAVCGVISGGLFFVLAGFIFKLMGYGTPNYTALAVIGLFVAVISIFGDLIASLIKRKFGVKDYGNLFPGHGGVMDRFDSVIAIAPILYLICCEPTVLMLIK